MKIIFLDIDGVLNSSRSVIVKIGPTVETSKLVRDLARLDEADHYNGLGPNDEMIGDEGLEYGVNFGLKTVDPVCVALVNKLLHDDVGLVLCSSHRRFLCHSKVPYGSAEHLRRLRLYLEATGIKVPVFFSITANLHARRGDEVEEWMNMAYENGLVDDDTRYAILDDGGDFNSGQPHVRCDPGVGMSFSDYAEACRHLGLQEPGLVLL